MLVNLNILTPDGFIKPLGLFLCPAYFAYSSLLPYPTLGIEFLATLVFPRLTFFIILLRLSPALKRWD